MAEFQGVPADFGYVIMSIVASIFMTKFLGAKVGMARKKFEVPVSILTANMYFNI